MKVNYQNLTFSITQKDYAHEFQFQRLTIKDCITCCNLLYHCHHHNMVKNTWDRSYTVSDQTTIGHCQNWTNAFNARHSAVLIFIVDLGPFSLEQIGIWESKLFWMQHRLTIYQQTCQNTRVMNFWISDKASSIHNYLQWNVRAPIDLNRHDH